MKKRKGSLLIAVTLLSVILLIIMMTILNLNRKNAELTQFQSDREKSFQAANIGLQKATEDIEKKIQQYMTDKNIETVTWEQLYKFTGDGKGDEIQDDYEGEKYNYSFKYSDGKITSTGTYKKTKVTLTANYAMDYMGISSDGINYIRDKTSVANIKSVYSYNTQYPMKTWINTDQSDGPVINLNPISLPSDGILTYYNLLNNNYNEGSETISNHYIIYERPNYNNNFIETPEMRKPEPKTALQTLGVSKEDQEETVDSIKAKIEEALNEIDNASEKTSINNTSDIINKNSRNYIQELVKSLNIESTNGTLYASDTKQSFSITETRENLDLSLLDSLGLKLFNKLHDDPSMLSVLDNQNIDTKDIKISTIKSLGEGNNGIYVLDALNNISEYPFEYDYNGKKYIGTKNGKTRKNIYLCQGRQVAAIPINATLVINGDLILAPSSSYPDIEKFYGFGRDNTGLPHENSTDINDLNDEQKKRINKNYPVFFVTGNLVVNGSIRGTGTVFSMNNITINALPSKEDENSLIDSTKKDDKNNPIGSKYTNYIGNKNIDKGAVIIHACNQLYIANKYSLDCLDNQRLRDKITASWILTQNRSILETISNYSKQTSNVRFSDGASQYTNTKTPKSHVQLSNTLPLGVPKKNFTGIAQGFTQRDKTNILMMYASDKQAKQISKLDHDPLKTTSDCGSKAPKKTNTTNTTNTTKKPTPTPTPTTSPSKYEDVFVNSTYVDPRFVAPTTSPTPSPTQTSSRPKIGAVDKVTIKGENNSAHLQK